MSDRKKPLSDTSRAAFTAPQVGASQIWPLFLRARRAFEEGSRDSLRINASADYHPERSPQQMHCDHMMLQLVDAMRTKRIDDDDTALFLYYRQGWNRNVTFLEVMSRPADPGANIANFSYIFEMDERALHIAAEQNGRSELVSDGELDANGYVDVETIADFLEDLSGRLGWSQHRVNMALAAAAGEYQALQQAAPAITH